MTKARDCCIRKLPWESPSETLQGVFRNLPYFPLPAPLCTFLFLPGELLVASEHEG